jgi:hypothetical protein
MATGRWIDGRLDDGRWDGAPTWPVYFIHDGYFGWNFGTPYNPRWVTERTAHALMRLAGLTEQEVAEWFPPAQFAEEGQPLYQTTGGYRFLAFGDIRKCILDEVLILTPLDRTDLG